MPDNKNLLQREFGQGILDGIEDEVGRVLECAVEARVDLDAVEHAREAGAVRRAADEVQVVDEREPAVGVLVRI